jgi:hypothetical protein
VIALFAHRVRTLRRFLSPSIAKRSRAPYDRSGVPLVIVPEQRTSRYLVAAGSRMGPYGGRARSIRTEALTCARAIAARL